MPFRPVSIGPEPLQENPQEWASGVFGPWRQGEQGPILVALEELIEAIHEPGHGHRVGLAASDLAGEGVALAALGLIQRFFLSRELFLEGHLLGQQLLKFVLWLHQPRFWPVVLTPRDVSSEGRDSLINSTQIDAGIEQLVVRP